MTDFDGKAMLDALQAPAKSDPKPPPKPKAKSTSKRSAKGTAQPKRPAPQSSEGVTTPSAPSEQLARRGMARQLERSGRCPMYAPNGTTCKTCGKVHPHE